MFDPVVSRTAAFERALVEFDDDPSSERAVSLGWLWARAGYPKTSQLPASYKRPAPTALAGGKAAAPATPAAKGEGAAASSDARNYQPPSVVPDGPTSDNPAGIRF